MKKIAHVLAFTLVSLLVACSGGGGDKVTPNNLQNPPVEKSAIDLLLEKLADLSDGQGPSFSEKMASSEDVGNWFLEVVGRTHQGHKKILNEFGSMLEVNTEKTTITLDINTLDNLFASGTTGGSVEGPLTASGTVGPKNMDATFNFDTAFKEFNDGKGLDSPLIILDGNSTETLKASGTLNDQAPLNKVNMEGVFSVSGVYGAKVAFTIDATFYENTFDDEKFNPCWEEYYKHPENLSPNCSSFINDLKSKSVFEQCAAHSFSKNDPGPDYCEFRLKDDKFQMVAISGLGVVQSGDKTLACYLTTSADVEKGVDVSCEEI